MAQGDTFVDEANDSVSGGTTTNADVRPGSGVNVTVKNILIATNDTNMEIRVFYRDFANSTTLQLGTDGGAIDTATGATTTSQETNTRMLDNDVGLRIKKVNSGCSSLSAVHAVSGVQHK